MSLTLLSCFTKKITYLASIAFFCILLATDTSHAQNISTIMGTGTAGYNGDGIAATTAQSNAAHFMILDSAGNIYVSEESNHRIRKINVQTGMITTIAGTGVSGHNGDNIAATTARINAPFGMAFDAAGNLYFADRDNHRVRKITMSTGIITTVAGTGTSGYNGDIILATAAQLSYPTSVQFDAADNMYIADWLNNRVRRVSKVSGIITTIAGTGTQGYNGENIVSTSAQINLPFDLAFDATGNIYFSEFGGHRIRKITVSNVLITTFAGTGVGGYNSDGIAANTAQVNTPGGLKFDNAGNLYFGDAFNNRVRRIDAGTNIITTVAGNGTGAFGGDGGLATAAQLYSPFGVCFDKNCNLLIADRNNNRIRKITGGFTPGCLIAVAPGNLTTCQPLKAVTINATNYNSWVPVYDTAGRIAAEIKANGNVLGIVNVSLYTKNGASREDPSYRLFLNRNITITPQTQPSSAVDVRLYIKRSELDTLRTAMNSQTQPSGVATINELEVFKNNGTCYSTGGSLADRLTSTNAAYGPDHYLQISTTTFSSFYFANKALVQILPVQLFSFSGTHQPAANVLQWRATSYSNSVFAIERSSNGIDFNSLGAVHTSATDINQYFTYTDHTAGDAKWYYRLKIAEPGITDKYSQIIPLGGKNMYRPGIAVLPNMVNNGTAYIQISNATTAACTVHVIDMQGKLIGTQYIMLQNGVTTTTMDVSSYGNGMYQLVMQTNDGQKAVCKFVKFN